MGIPAGTREYFGHDFKKRMYVVNKIEKVYNRFGYDPLQTPTIEHAKSFDGHHGEGEQLLFRMEDKQSKSLVLRYDLTVPFARFAAENPHLPRPLKRYQMERVFRDDSVDKGHFREFMQCDGDVIGAQGLHADADVINLADAGMSTLGFEDYIIRINHRGLIQGIADAIGMGGRDGALTVQRALDASDKAVKGLGWRNETNHILQERGFDEEKCAKLIKLMEVKNDSVVAVIDELSGLLSTSAAAIQGLAELREIVGYLSPEVMQRVSLDVSLARGADYYTGFILEGVIPSVPVGAVLGGGRYDDLTKNCGGVQETAVGMAFGLDRICVAMEDLGLFTQVDFNPRVLIAALDKASVKTGLDLAQVLRSEGIDTDFSADFANRRDVEAYGQKRQFTAVLFADKSGKAHYQELIQDDQFCERVQRGASLHQRKAALPKLAL